jgi:hypothetical protein
MLQLQHAARAARQRPAWASHAAAASARRRHGLAGGAEARTAALCVYPSKRKYHLSSAGIQENCLGQQDHPLSQMKTRNVQEGRKTVGLSVFEKDRLNKNENQLN